MTVTEADFEASATEVAVTVIVTGTLLTGTVAGAE
jgi:hypothetical protein